MHNYTINNKNPKKHGSNIATPGRQRHRLHVVKSYSSWYSVAQLNDFANRSTVVLKKKIKESFWKCTSIQIFVVCERK